MCGCPLFIGVEDTPIKKETSHTLARVIYGDEKMEIFLPIIPPTVTHQEKGLHAYLKNGQPHAVLYDSPELKEARSKLHAYLAPYRPNKPFEGSVRLLVKWCFPRVAPRAGAWIEIAVVI